MVDVKGLVFAEADTSSVAYVASAPLLKQIALVWFKKSTVFYKVLRENKRLVDKKGLLDIKKISRVLLCLVKKEEEVG